MNFSLYNIKLVNFSHKVFLLVLFCFFNSCSDNAGNKITGLKISFPGRDVLKTLIEYNTDENRNTCVWYWVTGKEDKMQKSQTSENNKKHSIILNDLEPGQQYIFNITDASNQSVILSRDYSFRTIDYGKEQVDTFRVIRPPSSLLPAGFEEGYIMVYRREYPGIIYLLNAKGDVVWYYQIKDAGFKVVNYTNNKTLLALVGTKGYETGYGNAILELSLKGDTLLYLEKGTNDFTQTIHHEIFLNSKNDFVTLCNEERIIDLRSKGGSEKDTVRGDGILILDRQGRRIWKWTVFDALDPLQDEAIMQKKKDWMHANSVSIDKDGNYLVSFYNNGQVWKINAENGRVIWKFGKNGDFSMPAWTVFDQAHSVHINDKGWLILFDNGAGKKLSRSLAFRLDEENKKAQLVFNTWLPPQLYSERMGSTYIVSDSLLLQCASAKKTVMLTDFNGNILWELRCNRLASYRAEFIPNENLAPFITN